MPVDNNSVRVALRIRPQSARERAEHTNICTAVEPGAPQITIGDKKSFTYDFVFDQNTAQQPIYDACIRELVEGTFDGYNATVLAYGQTGSGKTYTMGTSFDPNNGHHTGIIPRAAAHIFNKINALKADARGRSEIEPQFEISVQFIELYNEEIIDLLAEDRGVHPAIKIHEDPTKGGEIILRGVTCATVADADAILGALQGGALNRTTAATNMNQQSSRSHAIFTVQIKQQRMVAVNSEDAHNLSINGAAAPLTEVEMLTAKFHFVDLAGSERLKRTGATGDRAKEGISINSGLLALGNVISALGGGAGRVQHVPYRDSKLTRLLQDSLGGNSRTLMIACASPCDSDFVETLNTLNYANRAKNIRNKVVANQDKSSKLIGELRGRIAALEAELNEYRQGKKLVDENGQEVTNDQYLENVSLQHEVNRLRIRVAALDELCNVLKQRCARFTEELELKRLGLACGSGSADDKENNDGESGITTAIRGYLEQIQDLQSKLDEERTTSEELRKQNNRIRAHAQQKAVINSYPTSPYISGTGIDSSADVIRAAKREIRRRKRAIAASQSNHTDSVNEKTAIPLDDAAGSISPDAQRNNQPLDDATDSSLDEEEMEDEDEDDDVMDLNGERDRLCSDIVTLQDDINVQEALVRELERKERCIADMRRAYEKKLNDLSSRITSVEHERDKMLADLTSKANGNKQSLERIQTVKEDYERRLGTLRNEFRQLKQVEKENRRMQAEQARSTAEMTRIRNEIHAMKRNKVDLMNKLKEENRRNREADAENRKRVAAMEKAHRQQQYEIQRLRRDVNVKEEAYKRKMDECQRLKDKEKQKSVYRPTRIASAATNTPPPSQQPVSSQPTTLNLTYVMTPARTPRRRLTGLPSASAANRDNVFGDDIVFSPSRAKRQRVALDKAIARLITQRQNIGNMEDELERRIAERHDAQRELERMRITADGAKLSAEQRRALEEQCQSVTANMDYISSEIVRLQSEIVDFDDDNGGEKDGESANLSAAVDGGGEAAAIVECVSVAEAKYLLHHLVGTIVNQGLAVAKAEYAKKELTARIQQIERDSQMISQMMIADEKQQRPSRINTEEEPSELRVKTEPTIETVVVMRHRGSPPTSSSQTAENAVGRPAYQTDKARRRTATTEELLYATLQSNNGSYEGRATETLKSIPEVAPYTRSIDLADTTMVIRSAGVSDDIQPQSAAASAVSPLSVEAEAMKRSGHSNADEDFSVASSAPSDSTSTATDRLKHRNSPSRSKIVACDDVSRANSVDPPFLRRMAHTRHNKVLCVHAAATQMICGGRDKTASVWDLETCVRITSLGKHPNNVGFVRLLAEHTQCAITGSMSIGKVWDLRSNQCVRTLYSSGLWVDGEYDETEDLKDPIMYACAVDREERFLFTTYGSSVRVWSLGDFRPITVLSSNPGFESDDDVDAFDQSGGKRLLLNAQSTMMGFDSRTNIPVFRNDVSTLTVCDQPYSTSSIMRLAYGSRTGLLGIHDFNPFTLTGNARDTLQPCHHDVVTSTVVYSDKLFTASRAGDLMSFSLLDFKRNHVEPLAHNRAISSICLFHNEVSGLAPHLISACRGGTLKVWDIHSSPRIRHLETIQHAHSKGIRDVCCNSHLVFTAADDDVVAIWRHENTGSSFV